MINMNWEKCCWPIAGEGIFHGKCNIQSELATSYILAEYISIKSTSILIYSHLPSSELSFTITLIIDQSLLPRFLNSWHKTGMKSIERGQRRQGGWATNKFVLSKLISFAADDDDFEDENHNNNIWIVYQQLELDWCIIDQNWAKTRPLHF